MASVLNAPHFHNEDAAYAFVEARMWPHGPVCPHCGVVDHALRLAGKTTRPGLYKCKDCRRPFRVTIDTIFEDSHVPLRLWLQAIYLLASSKKGISSNQLHRTLGVTLKTAWFMSHRIREAMRGDHETPLGGPGSIVEIDETFIGNDKTKALERRARMLNNLARGRGYSHKFKVFSLIDRNRGRARSIVVDDLKMRTIKALLERHVHPESHLMTDEAPQYSRLRWHYPFHGFVNHSAGEYVRGNVHVNTAESFFALFKRGMKGVYQHCSGDHLHRYLAEFDFRYNERHVSDVERSETALRGIAGKRLLYRDS